MKGEIMATENRIETAKTAQEESELQRLAGRINVLHGNCQGQTAIATRIADAISGPAPETEAENVPTEVRSGQLGGLENHIDDLERQIDCLTASMSRITRGLNV